LLGNLLNREKQTQVSLTPLMQRKGVSSECGGNGPRVGIYWTLAE